MNEFEWDQAKAESNLIKHGIAFEDVLPVFDDPFALFDDDILEDYGEERFSVIGMVNGYLFYVSYTIRGDVTRIISARLATRHEKRRYSSR